MSCCGQRRAALTTPSRSLQPRVEHWPPPTPAAPSPPSRDAAAPVMLRGVKAGTIALRGPQSRQVYLFTGGELTAVAAVDVPALLRSGVVEPVGG